MFVDQGREDIRVAALRDLRILDTPRQACFDRITAYCANLFDCSFAFISLVDSDRQWLLASTGVDICQTPRDISFCTHVIEAGSSLLIADALQDGRFRSNPLVTAGPRIRSYIGQPIANPEGLLIGTLCIADQRPDHFGQWHVDQLSHLARIVEDLVEAHGQRINANSLAARLRERSDRLEKSNRIFAQAEKVAKMGSWELNLETQQLKYSDESNAILGVPRGQRFTLEDSLNLYVPEDRPFVERAVEWVMSSHEASGFEAHIITPAGERKRIKVVGEYLEAKGDHPARLFGILQDVTETYHSQLELQRAADYDALTNIFNRQAFDRQLGKQLKLHRRDKRNFFVLLFDLDGFKDINDTFGHLVGDGILEEISSRIVKSVPSDTAVARWGGDEFAVISPLGISQSDVTNLGETVLRAISDHVEIASRKVAVSATCGIARSDDGVVARELLRRADLALYYGKAREPGRVHHYEVKLERESRLRQEAISVVRDALDGERLYAGYQPIVQLADNALVGFEALMRLSTTSRNELKASHVMPAIADPILSRDISERMIQHLSKDFATIQAGQPDARFISLNATEADLLSRDFADRLLQTFEARKIDPHSITLEITETMLLVNDSASVQAVLSRLSAAGMQIALDDFGTGFSSLTHLRDFPIDKVKIDGSFVQKISSDHQSRLIVQALIAMAKNLGKEVIAEGIETEEQRDHLLQMGCDYGQGYLFGPAVKASQLKLLKLGGGPEDAAERALKRA